MVLIFPLVFSPPHTKCQNPPRTCHVGEQCSAWCLLKWFFVFVFSLLCFPALEGTSPADWVAERKLNLVAASTVCACRSAADPVSPLLSQQPGFCLFDPFSSYLFLIPSSLRLYFWTCPPLVYLIRPVTYPSTSPLPPNFPSPFSLHHLAHSLSVSVYYIQFESPFPLPLIHSQSLSYALYSFISSYNFHLSLPFSPFPQLNPSIYQLSQNCLSALFSFLFQYVCRSLIRPQDLLLEILFYFFRSQELYPLCPAEERTGSNFTSPGVFPPLN